MNGVGSGDSSRTSVPKIMASYSPWTARSTVHSSVFDVSTSEDVCVLHFITSPLGLAVGLRSL